MESTQPPEGTDRMTVIGRCSCGKPRDDCEQRMLALVQERDTWKRRCVEDTARLREIVRHERDTLRGAVLAPEVAAVAATLVDLAKRSLPPHISEAQQVEAYLALKRISGGQ